MKSRTTQLPLVLVCDNGHGVMERNGPEDEWREASSNFSSRSSESLQQIENGEGEVLDR